MLDVQRKFMRSLVGLVSLQYHLGQYLG